MKKNTQTHIAVAAGFAVVAVFFVFMGFPDEVTVPEVSTIESNTQFAGIEAVFDTAEVDAETGIITEDIVAGEGTVAEEGDMLTVHYVGALEDGTIFDTSRNREPLTFRLGAGQVISGWDQGLEGMREGGRRVLVIPPTQAYGSAGVPNVIPADATLIFEVELVGVQKAGASAEEE